MNISWKNLGSRVLATAISALAVAEQAAAQYAELNPASFACAPRNGAGRVSRGRDLVKIPVDLVAFPGSKCNDGSGAVFYVRRAPGDAALNKWHIHLQGGGACSDAQTCANRWCSDETNFGANKMSSQGTPSAIRAGGIFSRRAFNAFAQWNHVFIYYCSSDSWSGQQLDKMLDAEEPTCNEGGACGAVEYLAHFRGASIVDAVRDQLRQDCGAAACPPQDYSYIDADTDAPVAMPDLDDATVVLLSGSSAGSAGVRRLADELGGVLDINNNNGVGSLDFRAVSDAGIGADIESANFDIPCDQAGFCTCAGAPCTYDEYMSAFDVNVRDGLRDARAEASCELWHAAGGDTWRCADDTHIALHHLTTPFFVRQDMEDELLMENFRTSAFGTCDDYGASIEARLNALFTDPLDATAEEGRGMNPLNPMLTVPGVFGPQNGDHETLQHKAFFRVRLPDPAGMPFSFHDLLSNWVNGAGPTQLVAPFVANGPPSYCP